MAHKACAKQTLVFYLTSSFLPPLPPILQPSSTVHCTPTHLPTISHPFQHASATYLPRILLVLPSFQHRGHLRELFPILSS